MNSFIKGILILAVSLNCFLGLCQNQTEDLAHKLQAKIDDFLFVNTDSAYSHAQKLLQLGIDSGDSLIIASGFQNIGYSLYYKNDLEQALHYFGKARPIYQHFGPPDILGGLYMDFGNVYTDRGQFEKGLSYYEKADSLFTKYSPYPEDMACLYYNMAHVFMDINDRANQERYITKASGIVEKENIEHLLPSVQNIQANLAIAQGQAEKAEVLAHNALKGSKTKTDLVEQIFALKNLGLIALKRGHTGKGLGYLDSSLIIAQSYGDPYTIAQHQATLARAYMDAGLLEQAKTLALQAYELGMAQHSLLITTKVSEIYAQVLELSGDFKESLRVYKIFENAKDSINGFEVREKLLASEHRISEQKNQLLKAEASILKVQNSQNRTLIFTTTIALIFCIVIIALMVGNLKSRKKATATLQAKQLIIDEKAREVEKQNVELERLNTGKNKLFSIISHDLKEPFNQVSSFIQILERQENIDLSLKELLQQIKDSTRNTVLAVNNMLTWSKSQFMNLRTEAEEMEMSEVVNTIVTELRQPVNDKSLTLDIRVEHGTRLYADRNHVEIILRNLLSNAIKFSPVQETINLTVTRNVDGVEIAVRDNGKGMSTQEVQNLFNAHKHFSTPGTFNEKGTGLGMLIISEFVKENKGTIIIDSTQNKGSTFKVILPAA